MSNSRRYSAVLVELPVRGNLRQLLKTRPLALLPINNKPLLQYWLESLSRAGVTELTMVLNQFPEEVRRFTGNGERWGFTAVKYISTAAFDNVEQICAQHSLESERILVMNQMPPIELEDLIVGENVIATGLTTLADYWHCNMQRLKALPIKYGESEDIYISPLSNCDLRVQLKGKVLVDDYSEILEQSRLHQVIIGKRCSVGKGTEVEESVLLPGTRLSSHLNVNRMVVEGNTLYSIDHDVVLEISDDQLISAVNAPSLQLPSQLPTRIFALALFILTLPLTIFLRLTATLKTRQFRGSKDADSADEILTLTQFRSDNPARAHLPWLWQAVIGKVPLLGIRELDDMPPEWAADQAHRTPAVISLADVVLPGSAEVDEIALVNNFQIHTHSTLENLKLVFNWCVSLFKRRTK